MPNSSPRSVTPLVLEPGASKQVRLVTLAGLLLALLSIALLPLPLLARVVAVLLLLGLFRYSWQHHHALSGKAVTVRLDGNGNWFWGRGEQGEPVALLGDSYHMPFLAILNFRPQGKRRRVRSILLTTDNVDADTFRRLRIHLNWQGAKEAGS